MTGIQLTGAETILNEFHNLSSRLFFFLAPKKGLFHLFLLSIVKHCMT